LFAPAASGAAANTTPIEKSRLWMRFLRFAATPHVLALADQVVVSGATFLTTVMVGRWALPSQLGLYAIGLTVLVSLVTIQESLISLPYSIHRHHPVGTPAEHAGSSLTHCGLMSMLAIVVLAVTALSLTAYGAGPDLTAMTWALAAVAPFALLREFGRNFAFAQLRVAQASMLDLAAVAMQLGGLGWLAWTGRMSAVTACLAFGAACATSAIVWLCLARHNFAIRADRSRATMRQSWNLGKWLFAGQIAVSVQGYVSYWLLGLLTGMTATGVFAACISVGRFANPIIIGFCNILTPRAVLAWRTGTGPSLRRQAIHDSLLLGVGMSLACVIVFFAGEDVLRLLYHEKEYEGQGHTVTVLAVALLASAVGMPASNALASMERPRSIVLASSVGAVLTAVLVWYLIIRLGLLGAAYGLLAGNVVGSAGRWVAFLVIVSRYDQERRQGAGSLTIGPVSGRASVIAVVQQFTQSPEYSGWAVEQLDEGSEAIVYAVRSPDRQPIWRTHHNLAIKLYKPTAMQNAEILHEQYDSLSRLHAALHGRTVNGWKISTPEPLYECKSPPALVMSRSPGRKLSLCLETGDNVTPEVLDSAARAVVAAMGTFWSLGQFHGDLTLDNVLCDVLARDLSFIDAGAVGNCPVCDDITKQRHPAVCDLADMLSDIELSGDSDARLRKQLFTECILQAFIDTIGPLEEKKRLLDEIRDCALHEKMGDHSLSPRGLWYGFLKRIVFRRINVILGRLRIEQTP